MRVRRIFPALLAVTASTPAALAVKTAAPAVATTVPAPLAQNCADEVANRAQDLPETTICGPDQVSMDVAAWGGLFPGTYAAATIRTLPLVTARALDRVTPGAPGKSGLDRQISAWRAAQRMLAPAPSPPGHASGAPGRWPLAPRRPARLARAARRAAMGRCAAPRGGRNMSA